MRRTAIIAALAGSLLASVAALGAPQHRSTQKTPRKKEDPFLKGPAFQFEDLLRFVGNIFEGRLKDAVESRGIAFSPTAANIEQLKKAGASTELIAAILNKAPSAPKDAPPPAATPKFGTLALQCAPSECDIFVNGAARGHTQNGAMEIGNVPIGPVVIDFKKTGYMGEQVALVVKGGARVSGSATLNPTAATQQQIGASIFAKMLDKLGGKQGLADASTLVANGNATLWAQGEQRTEWNVIGRLKLSSNLAYLEIKGAGLNWWMSLKGSDPKRGGSGKLKGSPIALEMEKLIRLYRDYQLAALIARIESEKMKLSGMSPVADSSGKIDLRILGEADRYRFSIAPDGTPEKVVYESASGLGSGLEVVYADYAQVGKAAYPRTMAIRFSDQAQHGIRLQFDDVKTAPKLSDKEFHR
jgi:Domain of unknown function (DUF4292)